MATEDNPLTAERFFRRITDWRGTIVTLGVLGLLPFASFLPSLTKDTTSDAFIAEDNSARVYREEVKDRFGLSDPIVIAVSNTGPNGVFEPKTLALVEWLTRAMQDVPNIGPDRVYSLATESNIEGTEDGMLVTAFYESPPVDRCALRTSPVGRAI